MMRAAVIQFPGSNCDMCTKLLANMVIENFEIEQA